VVGVDSRAVGPAEDDRDRGRVAQGDIVEPVPVDVTDTLDVVEPVGVRDDLEAGESVAANVPPWRRENVMTACLSRNRAP
jgi:hypothetical protein